MSSFIPLPPTYAVTDPQVRAVLDILSRNMQVVIDSGAVETTNTTLTSVGGGSTFGSGTNTTNVTALAPAYTLDTLTADLKRGAAEVLSGAFNGTTIMKLEPAGQYVVFQHKDAVVLGTTGAYAGTVRTGLGITSTGILGGYNRTSDGAWQTTFAIESSTGNLTLLGTIRAASIISAGAYLDTTLVSTVVANSASVTAKLNKSAADILSGSIDFSTYGGFKTVGMTIAVDGTTTGQGVAFTSKGIVGRNSSGITFTIDATTGDATFKGDITGASGTFTGSITGATGTFTGTVQSAASGNRVILNESSSSYIKVYDSTGGTIFSVSGVSSPLSVLYANSSMSGASAVAALNVTNASGYNGTAITGTNNGTGHGVLGNTNHTGTTRNGVLGLSAGTGSQAAGVFGSSTSGSGGTEFGLYSFGRFGISNTTQVNNLNANYLQGYLASAFATVASGTDAYAANRLNGSAGTNVLRFVQGTVTGAATATFNGANKPASNSTNVWVQFTIDGTTLYIPAWT